MLKKLHKPGGEMGHPAGRLVWGSVRERDTGREGLKRLAPNETHEMGRNSPKRTSIFCNSFLCSKMGDSCPFFRRKSTSSAVWSSRRSLLCSLGEAEAECSAFFGPTTKKVERMGKEKKMTGEKKMNLGATTVLFSIRRKEKRGAAKPLFSRKKRPRLKWTKWYLFSRDYAFFLFFTYI